MSIRIFLVKIFSISAIVSLVFVNSAPAYWIWTPQTKKFINPKYAPKDSPKEQFEWAMSFYNAKDYQRAAGEFDKIIKHYEYSEYAPKAQYYIGLSYENMGKHYTAFQNYQKAVDSFPHIDNMDEILARQFNIAKLYATKGNPKIMGADIMTSLDRAVDIYKKVVENAPYGRLAEEAQFEMGLVLKRAERYDEAIEAFQKIVDDYPASRFVSRAQYELADTAYRASLSPAYDVGPTDKAIQAFEDLSHAEMEGGMSVQVQETVQRLKDRAAEKSLLTARFYESRKRHDSARVYYQDILDRYPESSFVAEARKKVDEMKGKAQKKEMKGEAR